MGVASTMIGAARLAWRNRGKLGKLVFYVRANGLGTVLGRIRSDMRGQGSAAGYAQWIERYDAPQPADLARIAALTAALPTRPVISLLLAGRGLTTAAVLHSFESLCRQPYPHWQLCVAAKAALLEALGAPDDSRLRLATMGDDDGRGGDGGGDDAAAGLNRALALADGNLVACLDAGSVLAPAALFALAAEAVAHGEADLLYGDEDQLDAAGRRHQPLFKPDWDPDLFLGDADALGRPIVLRRRRVDEVGGFRTGFAGREDYDLALRVVGLHAMGQGDGSCVRHLPFVLCHRRRADATLNDGSAAGQAVADHLRRIGSKATVSAGIDGTIRVVHPLPDPAPLVSLLVPTRDRLDLLRPCLDGLLHGTDYPALEVLVLDNDSREPETLAYFAELRADPRVRVLSLPGPFNFSAINNAGAEAARGRLLGFVNNDIKVIAPGWLREMAAQALRPEIGAVGAKLRYGDDTIQHGGVILGISGVAGHAHRRFPAAHPGYAGRLRLVQSLSAVTAACLVLRKEVFAAAGGFDAEHLAVAYNDVDLCLKLGALGYRVLWTPYAELYHLESESRGGDLDPARRDRFRAEIKVMRQRWGEVLDADPCYNPNLTLHGYDFGLAFPPRVQPPWRSSSY